MKALELFGFLAFVSILVYVGYNRGPAESTFELVGTDTAQAARIEAILTKEVGTLPSAIDGSNFLEEKFGDGVLGPSDYTLFCAFTVAPDQIDDWVARFVDLEPWNSPAKYAAPKKSRTWWLSQSQFTQLKFYSPKWLTGRISGWVGVDNSTGEIFVYANTT